MGFLSRKRGATAGPERLDPLGFPEPPRPVRVPPPARQPVPEPVEWEAPRMPAQREPVPEPVEWEEPSRAPVQREEAEPAGLESAGAPPLFIKIDRYREVVRDVQRLKAASTGLRDALDAMSELQRELQASMTTIARSLEKFNGTLTALDAKFVRVPAVEGDEERLPPAELGQPGLQEHVQNLHEQMQRLRSELKELE